MSFGFSVSDFITVGKLIADVTSSLKDASEEYQELRRELDSLQRALVHIDKLNARNDRDSARELDRLKCAALMCRLPLELFLKKIQKYENTLGVKSEWIDATVKKALMRTSWAFSKKDEVQKLQSYLNIHIGTINMMLLQHGLEGLDVASTKFEEQESVVKKNNSMLSSLLEFVMGDMIVSIKTLTSTVDQI